MTPVALTAGIGGLSVTAAGLPHGAPATGLRVRDGGDARIHLAVSAWELRFPDDALTYSRAGAGLRPERTGIRLDLFA